MSALDFSGKNIFFVGIKGTGMAALAELFKNRGAVVSGSDVDEVFYTDSILKDLDIPFVESFDDKFLPECDILIYSAAYSAIDNPQIKKAKSLGIDCLVYAQALGLLSKNSYSIGVAGTHGKTTTTALCGSVLKEVGFSGSVLVGSAVSNFNNRSTFYNVKDFNNKKDIFIAETCEYRRHFLSFNPNVIILTSVESDHLDYFKDLDDVKKAFIEYIDLLPRGGFLIFCEDDKGAKECATWTRENRKDIKLIPYGFSAEGDFKITSHSCFDGKNCFSIEAFDKEFCLKIPGEHLALDAVAAIALSSVLFEFSNTNFNVKSVYDGLLSFSGCKRRSEIVGEAKEILFIDDYAHHPTEIEKTLKAYKNFYSGRRLVVDFMSHTYSRTKSLLDEFSNCFSSADLLVLNKIYSSAREDSSDFSGENLFNSVKRNIDNIKYCEEFDDAFEFLKGELKEGDVFVTMGAGNNWLIGEKLLKYFRGK